MANFIYNEAKRAFAEGEIDLNATDDIRVILCMTLTTADTEDDVNTISAFTTLDECDDTNYARQALTAEVVTEDSANDRAEFDAADAVFPDNGVSDFAGDQTGARLADGAIVYKHVTTDADSIPLAWIDFSPDVAASGKLTIQWNAEGIIQFT